MCEELIKDVEENLNDSYLQLITQQYVYEMQNQYTGSAAAAASSSLSSSSSSSTASQQSPQDRDINQNLVRILESRKRFNLTNANSNSTTTSTTTTTTTNSPMSNAVAIATSASSSSVPSASPTGSDRRLTVSAAQPRRTIISKESQGDGDRSRSGSRLRKSNSSKRQDERDEKNDLDVLGLHGLELSSDSDDDGDDDEITTPDVAFGTKSKGSGKKDDNVDNEKSKSKSKRISKASHNRQNDHPESDSEEAVDIDEIEFANDKLRRINLNPTTPTLNPTPNSVKPMHTHETVLSNPGYSHLLTEAMIPTFLQKATKAINTEYTPHARGPYAMPYLTSFLRQYLPDAMGQLLAAYKHVLSKKVKDQINRETSVLLVDVKDYLDELLRYKQNVQDQFQSQQNSIHELEETIGFYKNQHEDLASELLLAKEQNAILKTELTDLISVKDMAIITLRDELQFFTKESQHWSDQISKLNQQVVQLKQERIQRDVEVAQLRAQKDAGGCCSIMWSLQFIF